MFLKQLLQVILEIIQKIKEHKSGPRIRGS
jgi:hypothetical protein